MRVSDPGSSGYLFVMPARDLLADFSLAASTGQTLSLDSFRGKVPIVLVFLDPGQTNDRALLDELDSRHREFGSKRTQVLAVAKITARSARELADEIGLTVPVLADASGKMARDHGVEDTSAIVADQDGQIVERFDRLRSEDSRQAVDSLIAAIPGLTSG